MRYNLPSLSSRISLLLCYQSLHVKKIDQIISNYTVTATKFDKHLINWKSSVLQIFTNKEFQLLHSISPETFDSPAKVLRN